MIRLSIAPMVDVTDRHFRYFCRLLTKKSVLYTEMITSKAIIYGDRNMLLDFNHFEKPLSLQIAACDKTEAAEAIKIAEDWDYDEINLNVGCPSDRVSGNDMGAALMANPDLVAEMVMAMKRETKKPITVKHRIGIDGTNVLGDYNKKIVLDKYEDMEHFVNILSDAGVNHFIVHARIAILQGLSPKENREIPPIRYDMVYKLKQQFPEHFIEINGGIRTPNDIKNHLSHVDGVMVGRVAYEDPFILTKFDEFFEDSAMNKASRRDVIEKLIEYAEEINNEKSSYQILRNILGLFHNKRGSKVWRQLLTPPWPMGYGPREILKEALRKLPEEVLDEI